MVPLLSVYINRGKVFMLNKSLYGPKQKPHTWFAKFFNLVTSLGFRLSYHDPTQFIKCTFVGCILLSLYVDDMIITSDHVNEITVLKSYLASHFEKNDLGFLRYFLGIKVVSSLKGYLLSQSKYMVDIFYRAHNN